MFTPTERDEIMGYLGLPITADQLSFVDRRLLELSAETEGRIRLYLNELDLIDAQIKVNRSEGPLPYLQLLSEAQRFVRQISYALGISIQQEVYSIVDVCSPIAKK